MPILTAEQKTQLRQEISQSIVNGALAINYNKSHIDAAMQALEDWIESAPVKTAISNTIDTATSPITLTAGQKKRFFAYFIKQKFVRENV